MFLGEKKMIDVDLTTDEEYTKKIVLKNMNLSYKGGIDN